MAARGRTFWKYVRGLAPAVLVLAALLGWVGYDLLYARARWWQEADEYNMREWLNESRVFRKTLPDLARDYLACRSEDQARVKAKEIEEQLQAMAQPTRMYQGQLPLFPEIYKIEVRFRDRPDLSSIEWKPPATAPRRHQTLSYSLLGPDDGRAELIVDYQLHAFNKRQRDEAERQWLTLIVTGLATAAAIIAGLWMYFFLKRERRRELQRVISQQQIEHAEKVALENELKRQEAERQKEEAERTLLQQELATQVAEQQALELKSQLYASIGIMAGSYAHNIKNLLVRPNDLLSRCLEANGLSHTQEHMLTEVRQTLGTVTERLQQILRTVRRDPTRSELTRLDLNALMRDTQRTWEDLAREKWKLTLTSDLAPGPLWIDGDLSHLQQAVENLVFNARDATFEMRNRVRDQARRADGLDSQARRQALIEAAAWKGTVSMRTICRAGRAILEVRDNGMGMTEEVRRRCTETHFTTKRDNAVHEGNSTGMGLGLSFVVVILEHHRATLEIESQPLEGALFRASFPLAGEGDRPQAEIAESASAQGGL